MNDRKLTLGVIIITIVLLAGGAYLLGRSSGQSNQSIVASSYSTNDKERPKAQIERTSFDLGPMKVSDEKSVDFIIKNAGKRPLEIIGVSTSCHCTAAKVLYEGTESQEFGMHSPAATVISEIAPSRETIIRITYRPFLMPVYGFIEREAYISTNDPQNSKITFKVTANVK